MPNETDLIEAARSGDTTRIISLLDVEPELVDAADEHKKTALHWAAEKDDAVTAAVLLNAGADMQARTAWGATPLEWAAVMDSISVADLLLEKDPGALTLITAAALGKLDAIKKFIGSGEDPEMRARSKVLSEPPEPSIEWPADTAYIRGDAVSDSLYAAARNGHTETLAYLLEKGGDINAKGFFGATGLHWAAINGHRATVEYLIEHGADITLKDAKFDSTPESWAEEGGFTSIAELLKSGLDQTPERR
jgi:ankyrin repeat protein